MRILSPAAEAMIRQETRVESILLVTIHWNGGAGITYSDREFANLGFVGKLINIGPFDDVINIDTSSNSNATSITLDDVDGTLKTIIDSGDITKVKVEISQWFVDLPLTDKFSLLIGEITSPIAWNEGDRTLTFNVQTRLLDIEAGFSIEEGAFSLAPTSSIGKPWPMVFGTAGGIPALRFIDAPNGILGEGIGAVNEPAWKKELFNLQTQYAFARDNAATALLLSDKALFHAAELGYPVIDLDGDGTDAPPPQPYTVESPNPNFDPELPETSNGIFPNDNPRFLHTLKYTVETGHEVAPAEEAHQQGLEYRQQFEQYYTDALNINAQGSVRAKEKAEQEQYNKTVFRVISQTMPQGIPLQMKLGPLIYSGVLQGEYFFASSRDLPEYIVDVNGRGETVFNSISDVSGQSAVFFAKKGNISDAQKFWWIDAGTELKLTNHPITYVAALGWPTITSVYGMRKGVRFRIPPSYYQIVPAQQDDNVGDFDTLLKVTYLVFNRPLSSIIEVDGSTWDSDEIEFDAIGEIGPNVVDIMTYLIQTYTEFEIDATSFAHVKVLVNKAPANFALTTRKNVIQLLKEIAYQARCSIWINDNKFFLRYLPEQPTPVDTITEESITQNTFSIESSKTDGLITKLTAEWKALYNQKDYFKIIYKYNTVKYGIHEETYDFYIYNSADLVEIAAQFWLIRKANNFKIVKFKTAIDKLKLETLDPVTIDLPEVANVPVIGIVQKATYDEDNYTIDFEVWVPVRFGEMVPYVFAYPKDLDASYIYPLLVDPNIKTANPFEGQSLPIPHIEFVRSTKQNKNPQQPMNAGRHAPIGDISLDQIDKRPDKQVQIELDARDVLDTKPLALPTSNDKTVYNIKPVEQKSLPAAKPGVFPGTVTGKVSGKIYSVDVYVGGTSKRPKNVNVLQFQIRDDDEIPVGSPVMVSRIPTSGSGYEYVMQAPVYLDNQR